MSLESSIMDYSLGIMGQVYPDATSARTVTSSRGYTIPEQIPLGSLPFAQAFEPVTTSTDETMQQQVDSLTFRIVLYDVQGNKDEMRDAFSALSREFDRDPTLGGLVRDALVTTYVVDELPVEDRTTAGAEIVATYATQGVFNDVGEDVELMTQSTFQDTVTTIAPDLVRAGETIEGTIELKKVSVGVNQAVVNYIEANGYPSLDTFKPTRFMRVSVYLQPELDGVVRLDLLQVFLFVAGVTFFFNRYDSPGLVTGWNHLVFDLDDPEPPGGGPFDLSVTPVTQVRFSFTHFGVAAYNDFAVSIARVFYRPEDKR